LSLLERTSKYEKRIALQGLPDHMNILTVC